jgi:hypothetical protein
LLDREPVGSGLAEYERVVGHLSAGLPYPHTGHGLRLLHDVEHELFLLSLPRVRGEGGAARLVGDHYPATVVEFGFGGAGVASGECQRAADVARWFVVRVEAITRLQHLYVSQT